VTHFDHTDFLVLTRARLATCTDYPGNELGTHDLLEWEGRVWKPTADVPGDIYVRELLLPREEPQTAFGLITASGRCRYDVFARRGVPLESARTLQRQIVEAFGNGVALDAGDFAIDVQRSERGGGIRASATSPDWQFLPVSFLWSVHTPTPSI
tara:strand:- start:1417 stop:1878 length:462 start_codon:yes stop_codon:yes gene_type:complete